MFACFRSWRDTTAFSRFYIRQYTPITVTSDSGFAEVDGNGDMSVLVSIVLMLTSFDVNGSQCFNIFVLRQ